TAFGDANLFVLAATNCAAFVWGASILNGGRITVTGTLCQYPGNTYTYSSTPTNRLDVQYTNGVVEAYYVTTMSGNFNSDWDTFLHNDNYFVFRYVKPGVGDIWFGSYHSVCGTNITQAQGTYVLSGISCWVDLLLQGTYCFTSDTGGSTL